MNLYPSQQRAFDYLTPNARALLAQGGRHTIVLQAPTGAGKTVIAGSVLRELLTTDPGLCAVWIAPFRLEQQAQRSLDVVSGSSLSLIFHDEVTRPGLDACQVLFVNWRTIDTEGKVFRRQNQRKITLQDVCNGARNDDGRKIILVIDESHHSALTKLSQEIIDLIGPSLTLEMSATPALQVDEKSTRRLMHLIERDEAVEDKIVRRYVEVNDGIEEEDPSKTDLDALFDAAMAKRAELARLYGLATPKAKVNPLLLVQLPDEGKADLTVEEVVERLETAGLKVGVWLHNNKIRPVVSDDPELISKDGSYEALVFKYAIATGWDCPRAQVLLKLRQKGTREQFDIQTVGRIMRVPEPVWPRGGYYNDERLNLGYVYHGDSGYSAAAEPGPPIRQGTTKLKSNVKALGLPRAVHKSVELKLTPDQARSIVAALEKNLKLDANADIQTNEIALGLELKMGARATVSLRKGTITSQTAAKPQLGGAIDFGDSRLGRHFTETLASWIHPLKDPEGLLAEHLCDVLAERAPQHCRWRSQVENLVLSAANSKKFESWIKGLVADELEALRREGVKFFETDFTPDWSLPQEVHRTLVEPEVEGNKHYYHDTKVLLYAYEQCFLPRERSAPEEHFQAWLEGEGHRKDLIAWWVKNGTSETDDFSIPYELGGTMHRFHPDYLVGFTDGSIGIFELKDTTKAFGNDPEGLKNRVKLQALLDYIRDNRTRVPPLDGGFIIYEKASDKLYLALDALEANWQSLAEIEKRHSAA